MADKNMTENLIKGLEKDLLFAIDKAVIDVQVDAHKKLQGSIVSAIRQMGLELDIEEMQTMYKGIMAHISFSVPEHTLVQR